LARPVYTTASCLSQIVLKFGGQPLPPQILPQSEPPSVDLSVGDIRQQIAAEWLEIAQTHSSWSHSHYVMWLFKEI